MEFRKLSQFSLTACDKILLISLRVTKFGEVAETCLSLCSCHQPSSYCNRPHHNSYKILRIGDFSGQSAWCCVLLLEVDKIPV